MTEGSAAGRHGAAASHRAMFPDAWRHDQDARARDLWDLSYPLPVPQRSIDCPICRDYPLMLKDWKFHTWVGTGSGSPWRCDVRMKCPGCAYVAAFGVAVSRSYYQPKSAIHTPRLGRYYSWRDGRAVLEDAGFFDA